MIVHGVNLHVSLLAKLFEKVCVADRVIRFSFAARSISREKTRILPSLESGVGARAWLIPMLAYRLERKLFATFLYIVALLVWVRMLSCSKHMVIIRTSTL